MSLKICFRKKFLDWIQEAKVEALFLSSLVVTWGVIPVPRRWLCSVPVPLTYANDIYVTVLGPFRIIFVRVGICLHSIFCFLADSQMAGVWVWDVGYSLEGSSSYHWRPTHLGREAVTSATMVALTSQANLQQAQDAYSLTVWESISGKVDGMGAHCMWVHTDTGW